MSAQESNIQEFVEDREKALIRQMADANEQFFAEIQEAQQRGDRQRLRELTEYKHEEKKALLEQLRQERKAKRQNITIPEVIEVPLLPERMKEEEAILIEMENMDPRVLYPNLTERELADDIAEWQAANTQRWKRFREVRQKREGKHDEDAIIQRMPHGFQKQILQEMQKLRKRGGIQAVQQAQADPMSELSRLRQHHLQQVQKVKTQRQNQR